MRMMTAVRGGAAGSVPAERGRATVCMTATAPTQAGRCVGTTSVSTLNTFQHLNIPTIQPGLDSLQVITAATEDATRTTTDVEMAPWAA